MTSPKLLEIARLVRQMRDAQRSYFRNRTPELLSLSKELERRVDAMVADVLDGQKKLF